MTASNHPGDAFDTCNVHLQVLDRACEFECQVKLGACKVADLLPVARRFSAEVMELSVAGAQAQGKTISCKAGCGACCRQLVPISVVEARHLADFVSRLPAERREALVARFAAAVKKLEEAGLLAAADPARIGLAGKDWEDVSTRYFQLQIACPFLEQESCSIYEERPLVCREYNVTTPSEWCATLNTRTEAIERPLRMGDILASTAADLLGISGVQIPLTLALRWSALHGASLDATRDGEAMFWNLLGHVDEQSRIPFQDRGGMAADGKPEPGTK
jgi:Fe-S-cluster containining protein